MDVPQGHNGQTAPVDAVLAPDHRQPGSNDRGPAPSNHPCGNVSPTRSMADGAPLEVPAGCDDEAMSPKRARRPQLRQARTHPLVGAEDEAIGGTGAGVSAPDDGGGSAEDTGAEASCEEDQGGAPPALRDRVWKRLRRGPAPAPAPADAAGPSSVLCGRKERCAGMPGAATASQQRKNQEDEGAIDSDEAFAREMETDTDSDNGGEKVPLDQLRPLPEHGYGEISVPARDKFEALRTKVGLKDGDPDGVYIVARGNRCFRNKPLAASLPHVNKEIMTRNIPRRSRVVPVEDPCHPVYNNTLAGNKAKRKKERMLESVGLFPGDTLLSCYFGMVQTQAEYDAYVDEDGTYKRHLKAVYTHSFAFTEHYKTAEEKLVVVGDSQRCLMAYANDEKFWGTCEELRHGGQEPEQPRACGCHKYRNRNENTKFMDGIIKWTDGNGAVQYMPIMLFLTAREVQPGEELLVNYSHGNDAFFGPMADMIRRHAFCRRLRKVLTRSRRKVEVLRAQVASITQERDEQSKRYRRGTRLRPGCMQATHETLAAAVPADQPAQQRAAGDEALPEGQAADIDGGRSDTGGGGGGLRGSKGSPGQEAARQTTVHAEEAGPSGSGGSGSGGGPSGSGGSGSGGGRPSGSGGSGSGGGRPSGSGGQPGGGRPVPPAGAQAAAGTLPPPESAAGATATAAGPAAQAGPATVAVAMVGPSSLGGGGGATGPQVEPLQRQQQQRQQQPDGVTPGGEEQPGRQSAARGPAGGGGTGPAWEPCTRDSDGRPLMVDPPPSSRLQRGPGPAAAGGTGEPRTGDLLPQPAHNGPSPGPHTGSGPGSDGEQAPHDPARLPGPGRDGEQAPHDPARLPGPDDRGAAGPGPSAQQHEGHRGAPEPDTAPGPEPRQRVVSESIDLTLSDDGGDEGGLGVANVEDDDDVVIVE